MIKSLIALLSFSFVGFVDAAPEVIAGWETWTGKTEGVATRVNGVTGHYESTTNWSKDSSGGSADGSFGNYLPKPPAEGLTGNLEDGQRLPNGRSGSHVFTLTDTSGVSRSLTFFHFDTGVLRKKASRYWKLEVVSGSLTAGIVASGTVPEPEVGGTADWHNYDVDLRGLPDHTLDANGTVVFRLSFTGGIADSPGHHQMLDNVAISTVADPAPSTLGLITASWIGLLFIRRRFIIR